MSHVNVKENHVNELRSPAQGLTGGLKNSLESISPGTETAWGLSTGPNWRPQDSLESISPGTEAGWGQEPKTDSRAGWGQERKSSSDELVGQWPLEPVHLAYHSRLKWKEDFFCPPGHLSIAGFWAISA